MKTITTMILLLIVGQATAGDLPRGVRVFHDETRAVTCWLYTNGGTEGGISCLPDSLLQVPTSTATDESQAALASLDASMCQSEQLPTTPLPRVERFQL